MFPSPPASESADPGERPMLRIAIVVGVEIAPASNERSMKDSGCETEENRDVAVSLASIGWSRGERIRRKWKWRREVRVRRYWAVWVGWPGEGEFRAALVSSFSDVSCCRGRAYPPRLSKVAIGVLGLLHIFGWAVGVVVRRLRSVNAGRAVERYGSPEAPYFPEYQMAE